MANLRRHATRWLAVLAPFASLGCSDRSGRADQPEPETTTTPAPAGTFDTTVAIEFLSGEGDLYIAHVNEADGGADLNGDGDADDVVVHVYDVRTGEMTNLGIAAAGVPVPSCPVCTTSGSEEGHAAHSDVVFPPFARVVGDRVVLFVGELQQGNEDRNGDGDARDAIPVVYDTATRTLTELELGMTASGFQVSPDDLIFGVHEGEVGRDLDGDGLQRSIVLHQYRFGDDRVASLGIAGSPAGAFAAGVFPVVVKESPATGDLNGDGDLFDHVFHLFDPERRTFVSSGYAGAFFDVGQVEGLWILRVYEDHQGGQDLNGNGSTDDVVFHTFDPATGSVEPIGVSAEQRRQYVIEGDQSVLLSASEIVHGRDLNGDGDADDIVPFYFDPVGGTLVNTRVAATYMSSDSYADGVYLVSVLESENGKDLDLDGDLDDIWLHTVVEGIGVAFNVGLEHVSTVRVGDLVAVNRWENRWGTDMNGDGDTNDPFITGWNPANGQLILTGWAGLYPMHGRGSQFLFQTHEVAEKVDLNGDGDLDDIQLILHDDEGTLARFDVWPDTAIVAPDGTVLVVANEAFMERDLNSDGDMLDRVFQILAYGTTNGLAER